MAGKKTNKVITIIGSIALLLILTAVIAFIYTFTNGLTDDFKTFYVEYEGSKILTDKELELPIEEPLRFEVKYTFDTLDKTAEPKGYKLTVLANATEDTDFEFTVDEAPQAFKAETESGKDFSKYFDIVKKDSYFTLTLHADTTMQTILEQAYEGKTVTVPEEIDLRDNCYFALVITSYNGKSKITIPFSISAFTLVIYPSHIII